MARGPRPGEPRDTNELRRAVVGDAEEVGYDGIGGKDYVMIRKTE